MKNALFLLLTMITYHYNYAQKVENATIQQVGDDFIFSFDLVPTESIKDRYTISLLALYEEDTISMREKEGSLTDVLLSNGLQFVVSRELLESTFTSRNVYDQSDSLQLNKVDITSSLAERNTDDLISPPQTVVKSEEGADGQNITSGANPPDSLIFSFTLRDRIKVAIDKDIQKSDAVANASISFVTYTVISEDHVTSQDWMITIKVRENSKPTITSFSPSSGPIGTEVIITGTSFDTTPENNIVYFGATRAAVLAATATELTVLVPAGATYEPITVSVNGLMAYSSSPFVMTFNGGGVIDVNSFASKVDQATGEDPHTVAIGDLDGDGKPDLAITKNSSSTVSVFRNTSIGLGSISYAAKIDYSTGTNPRTVTIGDLDGDGKPDLVVSNYYSATVSVLRNTSTDSEGISFATKVDYKTELRPISVSIGDLDVDGKPDLVLTNSASSSVSVFRNTSVSPGSISFATKVDQTTETNPNSVSIGDLDGDGKSDLVVSNSSSSSVSVFRNTSISPGSISFAAKVDQTTGAFPNSVSIGDLDGDGKPDLVVSNSGSSSVSVFRNTSSGLGSISFTAKVDQTTGENPVSVSIGDLDGDGKSDLAVANLFSDNYFSISLFRNTSTGSGSISYATKVDYLSGNHPNSIAISDLDGDGKPDLAVANISSATFSIFRNAIESTTSEETDFHAFNLSDQLGESILNSSNHTITLEVSSGIDLTSLISTFTLSEGATASISSIVQVSGTTSNDFTKPLTYTVTAEDEATIQDWIVTISVDGAPEITSIDYDKSYEIGSGNYELSASIASDNTLSNVFVYHKQLTESTYTKSAMSQVADQYAYSFVDSHFDQLGLTFYISAEDINANEVLSSNHTINVIYSDNMDYIPDLKSSSDLLDYAMISIPYQTSNVSKVFSALGSNEDGSWKLSHHNGGNEYQYYPADIGQFEPGKGYWFLSAQLSDFLLKGGSSVVINENNPFTMQLRATDWNMIGNPFPYPIDWQEVIDYNANHSTTIESLVTFENRAYNSSQLSLDKYEGALLYSSSNATLEIPLSAISNTSARVALKQSRNQLKGYDTGDWEIGLNLSSDEMAYNVSGIGMKPDGSLGRDRYDWPMLPRLSTYLDLTFEEGITKNVVTSADAHTWDFQVNSNQQSITLSWEPLAIHHSNHRLLLLDLENQTIIDMAEETSYDFNLAVESKPFKIQYVPKQDMQEYLDFGESFIGAPSPNPFNEDLTIPISITSANAEVEVTIYNVLGKVVFQLEDMEMKKGYHKLSLTLSEEFLRSNHSGIYILNVFIRTISGLKQVKKRIVFDK